MNHSEFDNFLETVLSALASNESVPERLHAAMTYALLGSGKRLRARLVLASAELFGAPKGQAFHVAAAIEMVHAYSLAHDDLPAMDNDDFRRGKPAAHKAFDVATAMLAGNGLLTEAFALICRSEISAEIRLVLTEQLALAAGPAGMLGGQLLDLTAEGRFASGGSPPELDLSAIRAMQSAKTGALFRFACQSGSILAKSSQSDFERMRSFADHLGFAFQIKDDLLDVEGSAETIGKAVGKDANLHKATLVAILGLDGAKAAMVSEKKAALSALSVYGERSSGLVSLLGQAIDRDH